MRLPLSSSPEPDPPVMDPKIPLHRRWRPGRCAVVSLVAVLGCALLLIVLALTIFRPRNAVTTVNSVRLLGLQIGFDTPSLSLSFNATLGLDISTTNPNRASFRYDIGDAELYYRGKLVGEAVVPPGEVVAMGTSRSNISLTVMAGRLIGDAALYKDVISGSVNFSTTTRVPGKVEVLCIKHKMVACSICDLTVGILSRSIENSNCRYKREL